MAVTISLSELSVDPGVEADDTALSGIGDERDLAALPRLEADRRPGWDVEPEAARLLAVEGERGIGLVEVVMRADLDRAVASICDGQGNGRTAGIDLDFAGGDDKFSG